MGRDPCGIFKEGEVHTISYRKMVLAVIDFVCASAPLRPLR
jgi:hypothetical protein